MAYYDSKNIKTRRMNEKELGWKKREKQHSEFQFNLETSATSRNINCWIIIITTITIISIIIIIIIALLLLF